MDRNAPRATSDEIDLYIRTYYSLLRSTGDVRVRAIEEAHLYSRSSLHLGALGQEPDLAAFAYSAARLPDCFYRIKRIVMGQSLEQFERAGLPVEQWQVVKTRGRRRPLRWDGEDTLAVYITSASDIDDLVPIVTAYQIEWNKIHGRLARTGNTKVEPELVVARLGMDEEAVETLRRALGVTWRQVLSDMEDRPCDMGIRLLDGSFREYQRTSQRWWRAIEAVARDKTRGPTRPVYFVSSNSHSIANLMGGYAVRHRDDILAFTKRVNLEGLGPHLERAMAKQDETTTLSILYYALRAYLHEEGESDKRVADVQASDAAVGIRTIASPAKIDVDAQVVDVAKLNPANLDPRLAMDGIELLAKSNAIIINIDYPLGMAAYHHLSALAAGIDDVRGVYVMGKAATLNGRVGDVMISKVVHDVHSGNTYLFRNALAAHDVQPYMKHGTVLDNQKALTVRSAFLQNRDFMDSYYRDGFTVMEMEAGPYLSAVYETTAPQRHPRDEIVNLADNIDFELGVIHYASDTPYSRRQELLSKSLSFFGVESTYGCAIAIARRIFKREIERIRAMG
ncbi:MAG: hypothetical protein IPL79_04310 [Myxococcales bacterium]|nr:hypothetical protein [Myxococcales bacterium]